MLLTLSQPGKTDFGFRPSHDYSPRTLHSSPYQHQHHSPKSSFDRPPSSLPASNQYTMSTSHRGLPPPSAMTLPDPLPRPPPTHATGPQPLGPMPAPPNQWQGAEDSMRNWLSTKAEEERRKQEEEKTRQESLKLEQRRVEQSMLRESMQGGVPPQMIPMIFAGIGGSSMAHASLDWLQQYAAQLQTSQQQLQALDMNADARRETRAPNVPQPSYAPAPAVSAAPVQPPPPLAQHQTTFPAFPPESRGVPGAPTSAPRSAATGLSRLNTVDLPQQQSSGAGPGVGGGSAHPRQAEQPNSSPSIYFHHWVPPAAQEAKATHPPTPSGRNEPGSAHPSHVDSDYKESPRKRKATGGHQGNPPPSQTSPSFMAQTNSRNRALSGHNRSRSQKSNEGQPNDRQTPSRKDSVAAPRHDAHREAGLPPGPTEVR